MTQSTFYLVAITIPELFQKAGFVRRVVRAMSLQIVSDRARIPMSGEIQNLKQEEYTRHSLSEQLN